MRRIRARTVSPTDSYAESYQRAVARGLPYRQRRRAAPSRLYTPPPPPSGLAAQPFTLRGVARYVARHGALPSTRKGGDKGIELLPELVTLWWRRSSRAEVLRELDRLIGQHGAEASAEVEADGPLNTVIIRRSPDEWYDEEQPAAPDSEPKSAGASPSPEGAPQDGARGDHHVTPQESSPAPRRTGAEARDSGPSEAPARTPGDRGKSSPQGERGERSGHRPDAAHGLGPPVGAPPGAHAEDPGPPAGREERTGGQGEAIACARQGRAGLSTLTVPGPAEPHRPGRLSSTPGVDAPAGCAGASHNDGEERPPQEVPVVVPLSLAHTGRPGTPSHTRHRGRVSGSPSACDDARALMMSLEPPRRAVARRAARVLNQIVQGWVAAAEADQQAPVLHARKLVLELVQGTCRVERCRAERQQRPQVLILGDVSGSCSAVCNETWASALAVAATWPGVVVAAQNSNCDLESTRLDVNRKPIRGGVLGGGPWGEVLHAASMAGERNPWPALVERPPAPLAGVIAFGDTHGLEVYRQLGALAPVLWLDSDLVNYLDGPRPCARSWWLAERAQLFPHHRVDYYVGVGSAAGMLRALEMIRAG